MITEEATSRTSPPNEKSYYKTAPPRPAKSRQRRDNIFLWFCRVVAWSAVVILAGLMLAVLIKGLPNLDLDFLTSPPSRKPENAGIMPALLGSVWACLVCGAFALPTGVGTAILLEEFQPKSRLAKRLQTFVQFNITNLAGVPSIVYGIIGLTAFVSMFEAFGSPLDPAFTLGTRDDWFFIQIPFGRGVIAGGLTLMLVTLPIVIISAQEALRAVPDSLRMASLAMGATRWQMVSRTTLPAAIPGIMTGSILAMSRAIGEAAPILLIAGIVYIRFAPEHLMDDFTAMPLQIYDWASRPQEAFHNVAASGILVLLTVLLGFNALAVLIRHKYQRPLE